MTTILSDTFSASLSRLTNEEQKQAKLTAIDLQLDASAPGLQMHRVDKARSDDVWSVRAGRDLRIILRKAGGDIFLVYVDHHDDAYDWARRRRIEPHPTTGALQIVEARETVESVAPPVVVAAPTGAPRIFDALDRDQLMSVGVPVDWIDDVLAATDDSFFELVPHLPGEASDALMEYAQTGRLTLPAVVEPDADPLQHPDTQRRFRVMDNLDELRAALDAPFEKWAVFLHPSQRQTVERTYSGPARVVGSAGTGKTVVALHRVMRLLQSDPQAHVLLTTYSETLSRNLLHKLRLMAGNRVDLLKRVRVGSYKEVATELSLDATGQMQRPVSAQVIRTQLAKAARELDVTEVSSQFLHSEWDNVIDTWQIASLADYAEVPRIGRKNRLGPRQRERLWNIFAAVRDYLTKRGQYTEAGIFAAVTAHFRDHPEKPFTHIVVDEAQDLGVAELRFLSAIAPDRPDALFFSGDLGQRIFKQPFSWKRLGVDVRGRSVTLRVNYRTSHQIRRAADRLLPNTIKDVDGLGDERAGTVSVFDGPEPEIILLDNIKAETARAAELIKGAIEKGILASEIGVFVRAETQEGRAHAAVRAAGQASRKLDDPGVVDEDSVAVGTMHEAKGLEFRMVLLMACDAGALPLAERLESVSDEFELDEVIATERQLLYVAATRARDRLVITAVSPGSQLLEDLASR